jgi:beta-glucosidase
MAFPDGFVWGAAAASYQIEGAAAEDGKGPSVWDVFTRRPGAIWHGHNGDVACDHYHRFEEDVGLMQAIGLGAYRLSISWPRVLPAGTGRVNEKGLGFYDRLVDALVAANIDPWVTLFHWDYPQALFERGGWLNPDSPQWFADYAQLVVERLSDRVRHWITLNEPQVFIGYGHLEGRHAPGLGLTWRETLRAAHHSLLAHGRSVQAIRAAARTPSRIGYAPIGMPVIPATDSAGDLEVARRLTFGIRGRTPWNNTWWMDPVLLGHYPDDGLAVFGADAPRCPSSDFDTIREPVDFFGVNTYMAFHPNHEGPGDGWPLGHPRTAFDWPVTPEALYYGPKFFFERYGKPIVVTENGLSCRDWISLDGKVHDPQRIDFLARYLRALHRAASEGIPVEGYFQWSMFDNFEWAEGYKERFGLAFVDYPTQRRLLKDSAYWYQQVITTNGRVALE